MFPLAAYLSCSNLSGAVVPTRFEGVHYDAMPTLNAIIGRRLTLDEHIYGGWHS